MNVAHFWFLNSVFRPQVPKNYEPETQKKEFGIFPEPKLKKTHHALPKLMVAFGIKT